MSDWWDSLVDRPSIFSRNSISYMVATNWRADLKRDQIASLKQAKKSGCCLTCDAGATAIANLLHKMFGLLHDTTVTSVPCGHSRVPDCLGKRLAMAVALQTGGRFVQVWEDRFVSGSSHPKAFADLPPLRFAEQPSGRVIVVDDVASSGWHLEEAMLSSVRIAKAGRKLPSATRNAWGNR